MCESNLQFSNSNFHRLVLLFLWHLSILFHFPSSPWNLWFESAKRRQNLKLKERCILELRSRQSFEKHMNKVLTHVCKRLLVEGLGKGEGKNISFLCITHQQIPLTQCLENSNMDSPIKCICHTASQRSNGSSSLTTAYFTFVLTPPFLLGFFVLLCGRKRGYQQTPCLSYSSKNKIHELLWSSRSLLAISFAFTLSKYLSGYNCSLMNKAL